MPEPATLTRHDADGAQAMRPTLLDIYQEAYGAVTDLSDPFFTLAEFERRLDAHLSRPGFRLILAAVEDKPVGYFYGFPWAGGGSTLLDSTVEPVADEYRRAGTQGRVLGICEIMTRPAFQRRGIAAAMHEAYLADREQDYVSLLVEPHNTPAYHAYLSWGYRQIGVYVPDPSHPYDVMIRPVRADTG